MSKETQNKILITFMVFCGVVFVLCMVLYFQEGKKQQAYCEKHGMIYSSGAHGPNLCVSPQTGQAFEYWTYRKANGD